MSGGYIGTAPADRDPTVGNDSVTTSKIQDDAVTPAKINIIDDSAAATSGQILVGDGTDFGNVAVSGDATLASNGALTIAANAVETGMIADNQVTGAKIAMGSDATGDIMKYNGTDYARMAMGSSEQVLRVNTAGNDLEFADAVGGAAWALKTGNYTAVAGDGVMVDTSSSAITITLPISSGPPALGDFVRILDATGNAASNNITVARNGNNIQGAAADLTISTNRAAIGLVYVNSTQGWVLIEN